MTEYAVADRDGVLIGGVTIHQAKDRVQLLKADAVRTGSTNEYRILRRTITISDWEETE